MPTYKNETTSPISWGGNMWKPGEEKILSFFVPASDLGLTQTATTPAVPGLFMAGSGDKSVAAGTPLKVDVPYPSRSGRYTLSVACMEGETTLALGDGATTITLGDGLDWMREGVPWERCSSITLSSTAGATVRVLMEEV